MDMKIPKINILQRVGCLFQGWKAVGSVRDIFTLLSRLGADFGDFLWARGHAQGACNTMQLISPNSEHNKANTDH